MPGPPLEEGELEDGEVHEDKHADLEESGEASGCDGEDDAGTLASDHNQRHQQQVTRATSGQLGPNTSSLPPPPQLLLQPPGGNNLPATARVGRSADPGIPSPNGGTSDGGAVHTPHPHQPGALKGRSRTTGHDSSSSAGRSRFRVPEGSQTGPPDSLQPSQLLPHSPSRMPQPPSHTQHPHLQQNHKHLVHPYSGGPAGAGAGHHSPVGTGPGPGPAGGTGLVSGPAAAASGREDREVDELMGLLRELTRGCSFQEVMRSLESVCRDLKQAIKKLDKLFRRVKRRKGDSIEEYPDCFQFSRRILEGLTSINKFSATSAFHAAPTSGAEAARALFKAAMNYRHDIFNATLKAELEDMVRNSKAFKCVLENRNKSGAAATPATGATPTPPPGSSVAVAAATTPSCDGSSRPRAAGDGDAVGNASAELQEGAEKAGPLVGGAAGSEQERLRSRSPPPPPLLPPPSMASESEPMDTREDGPSAAAPAPPPPGTSTSSGGEPGVAPGPPPDDEIQHHHQLQRIPSSNSTGAAGGRSTAGRAASSAAAGAGSNGGAAGGFKLKIVVASTAGDLDAAAAAAAAEASVSVADGDAMATAAVATSAWPSSSGGGGSGGGRDGDGSGRHRSPSPSFADPDHHRAAKRSRMSIDLDCVVRGNPTAAGASLPSSVFQGHTGAQQVEQQLGRPMLVLMGSGEHPPPPESPVSDAAADSDGPGFAQQPRSASELHVAPGPEAVDVEQKPPPPPPPQKHQTKLEVQDGPTPAAFPSSAAAAGGAGGGGTSASAAKGKAAGGSEGLGPHGQTHVSAGSHSDRERDRDREKERERGSREKEKEGRDRDRDREKDRDRDRDRERDREKDNKDKDSKERDRGRERERDRDRDRHRGLQDRDKDSKDRDVKDRDRDRDHRSSSHRHRERDATLPLPPPPPPPADPSSLGPKQEPYDTQPTGPGPMGRPTTLPASPDDGLAVAAIGTGGGGGAAAAAALNLLSRGKLVLVVDLDGVLADSYWDDQLDSVAAAALSRRAAAEAGLPEDRRELFRLPLEGGCLWLKLRPGTRAFLARAHERFELWAHSRQGRPYADAVVELLDPSLALFGSRVVAQGELARRLLTALDSRASITTILDSPSATWMGEQLAPGLLPLPPYSYFTYRPACVATAGDMAVGVASRGPPSVASATGMVGRSLLDVDRDECPERGLLAAALPLLESLHNLVMTAYCSGTGAAAAAPGGATASSAGAAAMPPKTSAPDAIPSLSSLEAWDVRVVLREQRQRVLAGAHITFSRVFSSGGGGAAPAGTATGTQHPLWRLAEACGASVSSTCSEATTHVVALSAGTEKAIWATQHGRFVVYPSWLEASCYLWRKVDESMFVV